MAWAKWGAEAELFGYAYPYTLKAYRREQRIDAVVSSRVWLLELKPDGCPETLESALLSV